MSEMAPERPMPRHEVTLWLLRRATHSEPARRPWPTCTRCHHKWHGLQCKATPCTCETAYEEPTT